MKIVAVLLLALTILGQTSASAMAQRLVSVISDKEIAIDSTFAGETLTLFGNVEPTLEPNAKPVEGPFNVVIVIQGPATDRAVRKKTRQVGIWLNSEQLVFKGFPSFFWVLSSGKLEDIADYEVMAVEGILPQTRPQLSVVRGGGDPLIFGDEILRLMTENGLFGVNERAVQFQSDTLYSARMELPGDIPNGNFLAHTYLFKDGAIIAKKAEAFSVRKTGVERLLGTAAREYPWGYGFAGVFIAIFTGWLGGVMFRR